MEDHSAQPQLSEAELASSPNSFKFPKLHGGIHEEGINRWLCHNFDPAAMAPPSETHSDDQSNLGDSTYEFVDTDTESRDGNATESIASTDLGRPDDVASLADTEQSDEESDLEEDTGIPTFGLHGPVETPTLGQSAAVFLEDVDRPLTHSIEFEEPVNLGVENISVKHTIADLDEQETAIIVEQTRLRALPQRLVKTVRQTMSQQGLSTREPLRIVYAGSHEAQQEIIHKIGSAVASSADSGLRHGSSNGLFNVVPVSSFGSGSSPEIELMHSSEYQINVEDVVNATNLRFEDNPQKPDVIKLILDDNFSYHSIPEGPGFIVEPAWKLPHIAIIYCSDNDTVEMKRTRTFVKTFMSRHKVPSILISHKQLFDKSLGCMHLDQHAIHMCLESRDPSGRGNIIHQRLPIDLASFLKVDSRQMNRNLAYLTGLHEPLDATVQPLTPEQQNAEHPDVEKSPYSLSDSITFVRSRTSAQWRALLPAITFGLSLFVAVFFSTLFRFQTAPYNAVSINGNRTSTEHTSTLSTSARTVLQSSTSTLVSLSTATQTATSTKTITVTKSQSVVSKVPNSVSLKPQHEIGVVSEKLDDKTPKTDEKPTICTAEVLGDREILIRIPSAAKLSWLSKEAMSVNISRHIEAVETERVYSTNDGLVLQFPKKEAYGMLNITVRTTRKPKINETFLVDFGHNWLSGFLSRYHLRDFEAYTSQALAQADALTDIAILRLIEANKLATQRTAETTKKLTQVAKDISMDLAKRSAIVSKEIGMQLSDAQCKLSKIKQDIREFQGQAVRDSLDEALFSAQVQSRLFWLKLQGRDAEYQQYAARAHRASKARIEHNRRKSKVGRKVDLKADSAAKRKAKCGSCRGKAH